MSKATSNGCVNTTKLLRDFNALKQLLYDNYPEMKAIVEESVAVNLVGMPTLNDMVNFVLDNKTLLYSAILEAEDGKIFREGLMPLVFEKNKDKFLEFASGIVGSFSIGQKQLQDVLRNTWGKYLSAVLGVNVIPPKALIVQHLKKKKQELTELIGLNFEVHDDVVVAKVNVAKYLEYLLSRPTIKISAIAPENKVLVYQFTDLAPWLKWSRYFTGITTSRLKVVELANLNRLVIRAGVYLGPDDYDTIKKCFGGLYEECAHLKEIDSPKCGSPIQVYYRSCAYGKQRRIDTDNSSSRSTFPIPDAPEHTTLLGNMLVISTGPVWTVEDTKEAEKNWMKEKPPVPRSEFEKKQLRQPRAGKSY